MRISHATRRLRRLAVAGFAGPILALTALAASQPPAEGALPAASAVPAPGAAVPAHDPASTAAGYVVLGGSPGTPAVSPRTGTVYVPLQCTTSFCHPNRIGHVVDVISTATGRIVATARVGRGPLAATVDQRTGTVYVMNGSDGTVSVLNGARCNAWVTGGCGHPVATITTGGFPVAAALNPATGTLYVADPNGRVYVINARACSAVTVRGCHQKVRKVTDRRGPQALAVDVTSNTVYTADFGTGNGHTVSLINGATCNGRTGRGCARAPRAIRVGNGAAWVTVDRATRTLYVANGNDGTVSLIDAARCNARVTKACRRRPPAVTTGAGPAFVADDAAARTVFVMDGSDNMLASISTRACNAHHTAGCQRPVPSVPASADHGRGYNAFQNEFALDPGTGTAYVATVGGSRILSVISVGGCSATRHTSCRRPAPQLAARVNQVAADPRSGTIYASSASRPQLDVFSTATCHAGHLAHCTPVARIPMAHPGASVGAVSAATHTLYAADGSTVRVINTTACSAHRTAGCARRPATVRIGPAAGLPALNPVTRTLYVPYGTAANKVAVISTASCRAGRTAGCHQNPAVVTVGKGTSVLAVSAATNTIYAPAAGLAEFSGSTAAVINGAACNGTRHSGCGHLAATITGLHGPFGAAVDDTRHSVYIVSNADGDAPGTVSVIDSRACNGTRTVGCHGHFPAMAAGQAPLLAALDHHTGLLYVTDIGGAEVSILDTARCHASVTGGCGAARRTRAVGSLPFSLAIDQRAGTVYVTDVFREGAMSVLRTLGR